jgi:HAD superfamily hydrolase (TIGR01484 family)
MGISKTLYISDLDGTLLNNNAELSEYTKRSLNNMIKNGYNFSVATARTLASAVKIMADVKLNVPIILMNGVKIYDAERKLYIKVNRLNPENVASVIQILRSFYITGFMKKSKMGAGGFILNEKIKRYISVINNNCGGFMRRS